MPATCVDVMLLSCAVVMSASCAVVMPPTAALDRLLNCAADKVMDGKSMSDLAANPPSPSEGMAKLQACLKELGPVTVNPAAG